MADIYGDITDRIGDFIIDSSVASVRYIRVCNTEYRNTIDNNTITIQAKQVCYLYTLPNPLELV